MANDRFSSLFKVNKPVIGMIHLAGSDFQDKADRALRELNIFIEEGVDGAIIENYHTSSVYLGAISKLISEKGYGKNIILGINYLGNPLDGLVLARDYGLRFVQFDSVEPHILETGLFEVGRNLHPDVAVLGGVAFKYQKSSQRSLEKEIRDAMGRCEAIVTTGEGTGMETPIQKLRTFRSYMGEFPLIVGAGVNPENVYEQLRIADSAIVGSCFKPNGNTELEVERSLVKKLMDPVKKLRNELDD